LKTGGKIASGALLAIKGGKNALARLEEKEGLGGMARRGGGGGKLAISAEQAFQTPVSWRMAN